MQYLHYYQVGHKEHYTVQCVTDTLQNVLQIQSQYSTGPHFLKLLSS